MGVHKLRWQYFAHYWSPSQTLLIFAKKCLYWNMYVMENLQSVEISSTTYSTTYLPTSSFQHSLWTPPFGRKRNRAKKGKKTPAKAFQKVIRAISEYGAYKRKCPKISCLWDRRDLKVLNDAKLIINENKNLIFEINLVSSRISRDPLFPKNKLSQHILL